jgi:hypothetical protein
MIIIRFPDEESKQRALGCLPGHFCGKRWVTGEMMVPEEALAFLAHKRVRFWSKDPLPMSRLRRYEFLLPRKFNDGQPMPES